MNIKVDTQTLQERGAALQTIALDARNNAAGVGVVAGFGTTADIVELEHTVAQMINTEKHLVNMVTGNLFDVGLTVVQAAGLYEAADTLSAEMSSEFENGTKILLDPVLGDRNELSLNDYLDRVATGGRQLVGAGR